MLEHLVTVAIEPIDVVPVTPSIRSSDAKFSDDFVYLLRRRYGLVKGSEYSEALALGTHFHALLEYEGTPDPALAWAQYRKRVLSEASGRQAEQVANDLDFAYGLWTDIIRVAPISDNGHSVADILALPHIRPIASELTIRVGMPEPGTSSTIQIDRLLFNSQTNQLSLFDLKSTGTDAQVRAAQCPFEFQTWHYLMTTNFALPQLIATYNLPAATTLAGMHHLIFRKPSIRMSGEDRDYVLEQKTFKSGPRKGVTEMIRNYHGQPRWHNFVERAKAWYSDHPGQVLRSVTHFAGNDALKDEYRVRLSRLLERTTRDPIAREHPRTESGATEWNSVSPYYPFYLSPDPATWPLVAARHGFKIEHRDPPIHLDPGEVLIESRP